MWAAIVNTILGLAVMLVPALFDFAKKAADNNYIVGPLIITFAITAIWEVNRSARWLNLPAGLWLTISPFILSFENSDATWINVLLGISIAALSFVKGKMKKRYGGGWKGLFGLW